MEQQPQNRLLIVDDDKMNLMVLTHILQPEYKIHVALDGKSGIKIAEKYVPDLILSDILMPDMDGYEVFAALRKSENTAHIPVIFITGLGNIDDEKKGLRLGAADYISKPFDDIIVKLRVQHQIKIVNQMRLIERLSMIDQLTDIPNRRNFDNRLQLEWNRAIREGAFIGLLMSDVDYFKNYNDTYGHQQGDAALRTVARIFKQSLKRATDFIARWGGEEFVVLLPSTDAAGCMEIGERIREKVEAAEISCEDGEPAGFTPGTNVTCSFGVNVLKPCASDSPDSLLKGADKALYAAKEQGRNRICLYTGEPENKEAK